MEPEYYRVEILIGIGAVFTSIVKNKSTIIRQLIATILQLKLHGQTLIGRDLYFNGIRVGFSVDSSHSTLECGTLVY